MARVRLNHGSVPHGLDTPANILVVKPSSLGDVVHTLPVVSELRRHFPAARISWLVNASLVDIARTSPYVDEIIPFDRERWRGVFGVALDAMGFAGVCGDLRGRRFDLVMDLQGLFRSGFLTRITNAPVRLGFLNARELGHVFYNARVMPPKATMHAVDRYLATLKRIGIAPGEPDFAMRINPRALVSVEGMLAAFRDRAEGPLLVISPFTRWPTKEWPMEHYAAVVSEARRRWDCRVVISASAADEARASGLAAMAPDAVNLAGRTDLAAAIALLSKGDVIVTGDSGPMHIADALGVPMVAIFGPTDPDRTGPYRQRDAVVRVAVDCAPCLDRQCAKEHECMRAVTPEMVLDKIKPRLEKRACELSCDC